MNGINWTSDSPFWKDYSGNPKCHLCNDLDGEIYHKGHTRKNGIILESSVMYCKKCNDQRSEEVNQDFKKWWKEEWIACEVAAEKNWEKYGIYTNVGDGKTGAPSTYFGYVKKENGFRPYRYEHPENDRDIFDRDCNDAMERILVEDISEIEKFNHYIEFLQNYSSSNEDIQDRIK
jgi:hypothetical protein